jgi:hypothetical protein
MAKYQFKVLIEGIDVSNAVVAPFTITNGRTNLNQGLASWSANLQAFKKETKTILNEANESIEITGPGSRIEIQVYDNVLSEFCTMFRGVITGSSSNSNTYSWSAIDEVFFALSNSEPVTYPGTLNGLDGYISNVLAASTTPFRADASFPRSPWPYYTPPDETRSDIANWIQEVASLAPWAFLTLFPPDERIFVDLTKTTTAMFLQVFDFNTINIEITDIAIDLAFSTDRNSTDIFNKVTVETSPPLDTFIDEDLTSVSRLGIKEKVIESYFNSYVGIPPIPTYALYEKAAKDLARSEIQKNSAFGYPIISFKSSYDRISMPTSKSPKTLFLNSLPGKVIDSSAVTLEEFQEKMVIQQVQHICSPDYWELEFSAANYRYVSPPQTWAEVTSTLEWENVPSSLTWDMIKVKDL